MDRRREGRRKGVLDGNKSSLDTVEEAPLFLEGRGEERLRSCSTTSVLYILFNVPLQPALANSSAAPWHPQREAPLGTILR